MLKNYFKLNSGTLVGDLVIKHGFTAEGVNQESFMTEVCVTKPRGALRPPTPPQISHIPAQWPGLFSILPCHVVITGKQSSHEMEKARYIPRG